MWMISNGTPFAAERTVVCDRNGSDVWVVAVKGTFVIQSNGGVKIAESQEEVKQAPKHRGDASSSSLIYESDLDFMKPTTDIILHGHAYAPQGKSATVVDVAVNVANIKKTLRVFGDRTWEKGLFGIKMTQPRPFEKVPLIYERAFGGTDENASRPKWEPKNPIGTGFAIQAEHIVGKAVPNVEYPGELISFWKDRPRPAGFGPIARHWVPRVGWAGTYDEKWEKERFPLLPADFNERFFQYAPEDQQSQNYLRGGELVELYNLSSIGLLRFNLPRIALGFRTRIAGKNVDHRSNLHSVIFEPDASRFMMVWVSALPCQGSKYSLERTVVFQKKIL
jgi:hypothetical protein